MTQQGVPSQCFAKARYTVMERLVQASSNMSWNHGKYGIARLTALSGDLQSKYVSRYF